MTRPYLIIPDLIEQPTWGGHYILELKNWQNRPEFQNIKIGQSHELWGKSYLAVDIFDSSDPQFGPNTYNINKIPIQEVLADGETMPLLIKLNQALGNSFQLHIRPEEKSDRWLPKPESWYFLENGFISLGIKNDISVDEYRKTCIDIYRYMQDLSGKILSQEITLDEARKQANEYIKEKNPWQFVNLYPTRKNDLIDLSMGAIHHSWEENREKAPLGNIVFEVQLDASDDAATIRSFDQGKIKDDGTIRTLNIEDYFEHLDRDPGHNKLEYLKRTADGEKLLKTRFYSVNLLEISEKRQQSTDGRFHHLYVRDGDIHVSAGGTTIRITRGHSCFIPSTCEKYDIETNTEKSVVIQTFA
ncbi:hypothetical protein IPM65_02755 [Candidatus Roizmanbacteria bacterium]|nr:MAG: hypothetical protein IPM65_02755 [Candidatus Roizmanbacteria bacterium]